MRMQWQRRRRHTLWEKDMQTACFVLGRAKEMARDKARAKKGSHRPLNPAHLSLQSTLLPICSTVNMVNRVSKAMAQPLRRAPLRKGPLWTQ